LKLVSVFQRSGRRLSLDVSKVVGCLISHEHGDHSKHIVKYAKSGINILASKRVFDAKPMEHYRKMGIIVEPGEEYMYLAISVWSLLILTMMCPALAF
jgi:metal-dependent hydrolase (beta-lactamase superfamily II)